MDGRVTENEIMAEIANYFEGEVMLPGDVTVQAIMAQFECTERVARARMTIIAKEQPGRYCVMLVNDGHRKRTVLRRVE